MLAKIGLILFTGLYALQAFVTMPVHLLEISAGIAFIGLLVDGYVEIRKS